MKRLETADMSLEELQKKLVEMKEELFQLRFKYATSQLENTARIRSLRRDVARCLTAVRARELAKVPAAG